MRQILLTFALSLVAVLPASAQQLKLSFNEGRVSLEATGVPVRTILTEWANLGGTKVIGAERITGSPLTLKLDDVPEAQALEIVLRSVAGYMVAPRRASPHPAHRCTTASSCSPRAQRPGGGFPADAAPGERECEPAVRSPSSARPSG